MRVKTCLMILVLLAAWAGSQTALAGELSIDLEAYLATAPADETIRVIIRPVGAVDGTALKRQLATTYAKRADRHREALSQLQAAASSSQGQIMPVLNRLRMENRLQNIKTYWIDNFISAEVTPDAIRELAAREDIEKIYPFPQLVSIAPLNEPTYSKPAATRAEFGLRIIGADQAWAAGYTGTGRLIASVETGVDGSHPALASKWRGNNGYSKAESWYDPIDADSIPHTYGDPNGTRDERKRYYHGTSVTGLLVGHDPSTGDTTGVAFGAQWISAAVVNIPGADVFQGLQWLIDPDGNPNTEDDVPDVINNSWGYISFPDWVPLVECDDLFWNVIDNLEAAGAITVWAAGNEGWDGVDELPQSIRNPANRITSDVNAFAVGLVYGKEPDSLFFMLLSSRGPSDCDGLTPKPEVVAPGWLVRSTFPGGTYSNEFGGTSYAVPLVAGAAALLREYNPNATADEVKRALLYSATDLSPEGDDNNTGMGLINIPAALSMMPENTEPFLYMTDAVYDRPAPGGSTDITVTVKNQGTFVPNVSLELVSLDSRLTVNSGPFSFQDFNPNESKDNSADPFSVTLAEDVIVGERLPVEWRYTGINYSRTTRGAIAVGEALELDVFTHDIGNVVFTISSFGEYGLDPNGSNSWRAGGRGFFHPGDRDTSSLFEMGFLVGAGPDHVSDATRQIGDFPDKDFLADVSGNLRVVDAGDMADQQTFAAFSDANADNPMGLFIEQRSFAYADTMNDDYVIMEYVIHNRSDSALSGVRAAIFADWDFPWGTNQSGLDVGSFDSAAAVGWMNHKVEGFGYFRGIAALTPDGMVAYRYQRNDPFIYDGLSEEKKWHMMTAGFDTVGTISTGDASQMMTIGEFDLAPGDSAIAAFAIIGAVSKNDMIEFAKRAQKNYRCRRGLSSEIALEVEPAEVTFIAEVGGPIPSPQNILITNFCGDTTWILEKTASWLVVDQQSGRTPSTVQLSVTDFGTTVGEYFDTLSISSEQGEFTIRVPVTLTIAEGLPRLRLNPAWLVFSSVQFGTPPQPKSFWVINDGFSGMEWSLDEDISWSGADPSSGTVEPDDSVEVNVEIDTTGLSPAVEYLDSLKITAPGASLGSPSYLKVEFELIPATTRASNSPNPFNPYEQSTTINLGLTAPSSVEVKIFDLTGYLVSTLFAGWVEGGGSITWDGRADDGPEVADGVYLCHIKSSDEEGNVREQVLKIAVAK